MRDVRRVLGIVFVIAVVVAASPLALATTGLRTAAACSCVQLEGLPDDLARSDAVFAGTVTHIVPAAAGSTANPVWVSFAVETSWKGPAEPVLRVVTAAHEVSCGYAFTEGYAYVVYAYEQSGALQTSFCSRTALLAEAGADLAALGPGTPVTQQPEAVVAAAVPPADGDSGLDAPIVIVLVVAAVAALGIGASVVWRIRRA